MILRTEKDEFVDLSRGIDLSIPLSNTENNPLAWNVTSPSFEPVRDSNWEGLVEKGASVNFRNISFNPHGHGTHTECIGHITEEIHSINQHLQQFFFRAILISVDPEKINQDEVITSKSIEILNKYQDIEALIIRTLPNSEEKKSRKYSGTNPPFLDVSCLEIINRLNVKHLLVDLPSVDKEKDEGRLAFHRGFWEVATKPRFDRTITELIFVPNHANDGAYLLNLQVAPFENDAAPSRPVIYAIQKQESTTNNI